MHGVVSRFNPAFRLVILAPPTLPPSFPKFCQTIHGKVRFTLASFEFRGSTHSPEIGDQGSSTNDRESVYEFNRNPEFDIIALSRFDLSPSEL